MMKTHSAPICLLASSLLLSACGRRDDAVRSYQEVTYQSAPPASAAPHPPMGGAPMQRPAGPMMGGAGAMQGNVPTAALNLAWNAPDGWVQQPARSMRLASFQAGDAECALSAFPGDTGGETANLKRWLGQLGAEGTPAELAALDAGALDFETEGGWSGRLFDFTPVLPSGAASSMRAAILPVSGQTVFVKLTGPPAALSAQAAALEAFCKSLRPGA